VIVDGSGSNLDSNQSLDIEGGSLAVQNAGAVVSESADVNGSALLDGPGSTWTTGQTFVASDNYGSLTIQNGAVLSSNGFAAIGDTQRGSGLVTVDGAGSRWDNDFDQAQLFVGFGFTGTLSISGGGVVSTFGTG
jgi:T5SS/PEP-CTERM-associated repeat protein